MFDDLRFALRQLRRSPGFALAVIFTLALGVGVNTAVFSMVDGFMLRRLPYTQPERIAALMTHVEGWGDGRHWSDEDDSHVTYDWTMVRENVPAVTAAAYEGQIDATQNGVNLKTDAEAGGAVRFVRATAVSAHYFEVLGVQPYLGRDFTEDESRVGGAKAVILSYALWQSTFRGDRNVVGKAVDVKGEPYTVVGVLPPDTVTPNASSNLWGLAAARLRKWGVPGLRLRHPDALEARRNLAAGTGTTGAHSDSSREPFQALEVMALCAASAAVHGQRFETEAAGAADGRRVDPVDWLRQPRRADPGANLAARAGDCDAVGAGRFAHGCFAPAMAGDPGARGDWRGDWARISRGNSQRPEVVSSWVAYSSAGLCPRRACASVHTGCKLAYQPALRCIACTGYAQCRSAFFARDIQPLHRGEDRDVCGRY